MKKQTLITLRLNSQGLSAKRFSSAHDVSAFMGPIQGQDYPGGKWSIGLRCGFTDMDIEKAIADREIVRAWPIRGTLHFVSRKDLRPILLVTRPFLLKQQLSWYKGQGLTEKIFSKSFDVLINLLRDGNQATRDEISSALMQNKIDTGLNRLSFILYRAGMEGLVCFATRKGKQFTYALADEWIPEKNILSPDEALVNLSTQYFQSRGPASVRDFMWWAGLPKKEALRAIEMIRGTLHSESFDGNEYFFTDTTVSKGGPTLLLQGFDEYLLGYTDRTAVLDLPSLAKLNPGNALFLSTIIHKGSIVGTWKKTIAKNSLTLQISPFQKKKTSDIPGLKKACGQYAKFLGLTLDMEA